MKREIFVAASLLVTHAYARRAEEFCRKREDLDPDLRQRLLRKVEGHCESLLRLAGAPAPERPCAQGQ